MPQHRPRKRFGQHFLIDDAIIQSILDAINPEGEYPTVEIGPGQGALTDRLVERNLEVIAIEIDRDLVAKLKTRYPPTANINVITADALKLDLAEITNSRQADVVGNLPYNISTPLLAHLLTQLTYIRTMTFMLQKEVVDRMCASHGTKSFGRLSLLIQSHCQAVELFTVPPEAFAPPPKVDSSVVRLIPLAQRPDQIVTAKLQELALLAFTQRRKMIKKSVAPLCTAEELQYNDIDPNTRPEHISLNAYWRLAQYLCARSSGD